MAKLQLNITLIQDRLTIIRNSIIEMKNLANLSKQAFISDSRNYAACETFLRHALEAMFDIGRHILARIGGFRLELEYKSIARGLGEKRIVSQRLVKRLIPIAGYRNRIVHFYHQITPDELYRSFQKLKYF